MDKTYSQSTCTYTSTISRYSVLKTVYITRTRFGGDTCSSVTLSNSRAKFSTSVFVRFRSTVRGEIRVVLYLRFTGVRGHTISRAVGRSFTVEKRLFFLPSRRIRVPCTCNVYKTTPRIPIRGGRRPYRQSCVRSNSILDFIGAPCFPRWTWLQQVVRDGGYEIFAARCKKKKNHARIVRTKTWPVPIFNWSLTSGKCMRKNRVGRIQNGSTQ